MKLGVDTHLTIVAETKVADVRGGVLEVLGKFLVGGAHVCQGWKDGFVAAALVLHRMAAN